MAFMNPIPFKGFSTGKAVSFKPAVLVPSMSKGSQSSLPKPETQTAPETSSQTTTSTQESASKPRSRWKGGNKSKDRDDDGNGYSKANARTTFYDEGTEDPVGFKFPIHPTVHVNELDTLRMSYSDYDCKVLVNLASYSMDPFNYDVSNHTHYQLIYDRYTRLVLAKVRSGIVNSWNFPNFLKAINAVTKALEIYYTVDSLMTYKSSNKLRDKNIGTLAYQTRVDDFRILSKQNELLKTLKGAWFPHYFSDLIRYTYQWYKYEELDQATNFRFIPHECFLWLADHDSELTVNNIVARYNSILTELRDIDCTKIYSILSDVIPTGRIVNLKRSCHRAVYDKRIIELFSNQPVFFSIKEDFVQCYPSSIGMSDIPYCMNQTPSLDSALPFALQTICEGGGPQFEFRVNFFKAFPAVAGELVNRTNKWRMQVTSKYSTPHLAPRNSSVTDQSSDVHRLYFDIIKESGPIRYSTVPAGFQRVYFDNKTAPTINLTDFMDSLYGLQ